MGIWDICMIFVCTIVYAVNANVGLLGVLVDGWTLFCIWKGTCLYF